MHNPLHFKQSLQAILTVTAGWFCFVCSDTILKTLTPFYSPSQIIWTVNMIGLAATSAWILGKYGTKGFLSPRWKFHAVRGALIAVSAFCVVRALRLVPLADFYGVVFIAPILLMLLSHFFLDEKVGWHRLSAAVAGFGGVLVIAGPQFDHLGTGFLLTVCVALSSAANGIITRKVRAEPVLPLYAFYPFLFNAVLHTPMLPGFEMPPAGHIMPFLTIPVFILTGFICYAVGFTRAPEVGIVAPFHYTQIIWGAIFGYVLFGDVPSFSTVLGTAIIIAAGLYIIWRERYLHRLAQSSI